MISTLHPLAPKNLNLVLLLDAWALVLLFRLAATSSACSFNVGPRQGRNGNGTTVKPASLCGTQ